jgi:tRNA modification GTPase
MVQKKDNPKITPLNDTIAAISTPPGFGGIGVVRISGPDSHKIGRDIFRAPAPKNRKKSWLSVRNRIPAFKPRKMYHGHVAIPGRDETLDEVLMVYMPAPNSYTAEDVVEIQAHAGTMVLKKILDLVLDQGARLAEAGEFTRRAYLNGRIDLSQAEAVIDVIQAKTETALKIASRHLEGTVARRVHEIKESLTEVHALLEADIEFPEDIEEDENSANLCKITLEKVGATINGILGGYEKGHLLRDGLRLAIIGKVNVGKSSLLNRLMDKERAIVTEVAGTTRDHIEETIDISGLPVILIDTAGWRDTKDPVEKIGIEKTKAIAETADLVLYMVDTERGIISDDQDLYGTVKEKEKILVINKKDLIKGMEGIDIPEEMEFKDVVYTSVKFNQGVDTLTEKIYRFGTEGWGGCDSEIVPNLRQKRLFEKAHGAVARAGQGLLANVPPELTVIDLKEAMDALDEVAGISVKTDVLDTLFSRFCIGK